MAGHTTTSRAQALLAAESVRSLALEAGFAEAGVVALPYAAEARDAERFRAWISKGRAGTMRYLERRSDDGSLARERVAASFPWARSAIVCFASYLFPEAPLSTTTQNRPSPHRPAGTKNSQHQPSAPGGSNENSPGWTLRAAKGESWEVSQQNVLSPVGATGPDLDLRGNGWIARYAWTSRIDERGVRGPSDYHKALLKRLKMLEARLHAQFGEFEARAYVDTGPVVERALAVAAGVGWVGKNTCLIHPKLGSFGFLAVLLTSLEVQGPATSDQGPRDQGTVRASGRVDESATKRLDALPVATGLGKEPGLVTGHDFSRADQAAKNSGALAPEGSSFEVPDRCGTCTRCIEACPTHALDAPYQMDAARCISYLTIEHKGPIAEELMPGMGRQVFGCDVCQDVCPWNAKALRQAPIATDAELEPRPELINPALEWLASLDEPSFEREFNGSPVRRAGFNGLRRNVAIAMGNSRLAKFAPKLEEWANAADDGLRSAAQWALDRLRRA